jgi:hypothetical protein
MKLFEQPCPGSRIVATLIETQALFRQAVVNGEVNGAAALLNAGIETRIAIHRRNYQASLVDAIICKFPAVAWLAGETFVIQAAEHYIEQCPPQKPCIAEYGETFPEFLAVRAGAQRVPYLKKFAELEWHVGHITIAVPEPHSAVEALSSTDPETLPKLRLRLQQGVRYLQADWPIDELMKLYVTDCEPDQLEFAPCDVFLEVRGARGEFQINRLQKAEFRFRASLANGAPIGDAAEHAMDIDALFDAGAALVRVFADDLVTSIVSMNKEEDI